jgi:hypothetical protein
MSAGDRRYPPGAPSAGFSRGWEKLHLAVQVLTGTAAPRERLIEALIGHLVHLDPADDLPYELREEFSDFVRAMTTPLAGAEGQAATVPLRVSALDAIAVQRAYDRILDYYDTVCRYMPRHW